MVTCLTVSAALMALGVILVYVAFVLSCKSGGSREKSTPFECGFDPQGGARIPFSLRFFLLGVVFLIFDAEIALLLPLAGSGGSLVSTWSVLGAVFLGALLGGTIHEWREGALDWKLWD